MSRRIMRRQFFSKTKFLSVEKKCSCQIRTQDFCSPKRIHYLQTKGAGYTKKLELTRTEPKFTITNFDHAVPRVIYGKKSSARFQYPCYRKGEY